MHAISSIPFSPSSPLRTAATSVRCDSVATYFSLLVVCPLPTAHLRRGIAPAVSKPSFGHTPSVQYNTIQTSISLSFFSTLTNPQLPPYNSLTPLCLPHTHLSDHDA
jgi:hypothetical protein